MSVSLIGWVSDGGERGQRDVGARSRGEAGEKLPL